VREMWIVDPDSKAIEVRSFEAGTTSIYKTSNVLRSAVLVEIQIAVAAVFPESAEDSRE
jgi:Uma2 family endonuclease